VPLVSLDRVSIAFGHLPLLDGITLQIDARERVSVIGRNGTGKSTLLKIVNGDLAPDSGAVWRQPALKTARLEQDPVLRAEVQALRRLCAAIRANGERYSTPDGLHARIRAAGQRLVDLASADRHIVKPWLTPTCPMGLE